MAVLALFFAALACACTSLLLRGVRRARVPWVLPGAALSAFGASCLAYGFAVRELPVRVALPVLMVVALLLTVCASWLWRGGRVSLRALAGVLVLAVAMALIG